MKSKYDFQTNCYIRWHVRELQHKNECTMAELARGTGIVKGTLYNIDNRKDNRYSEGEVKKIAEFFGVTEEYLCEPCEPYDPYRTKAQTSRDLIAVIPQYYKEIITVDYAGIRKQARAQAIKMLEDYRNGKL